MEAIVIHELEQFAFEPLSSYVDIQDLYVGDTSIFMETLNNLYYSGIKKVYFLVEQYKVSKYEHLEKYYNFGKKESQLYLKVVGLNVDKMDVGPVLREFFSLFGQIPHFVLLYSNTLLTVPLIESFDTHTELSKSNSKYCMSVLFVDDLNKRFSNFKNTSVVLHDEKNELLFMSNENVLSLNLDFLNYVKNDDQIMVRYDLYQSSVYLCTHGVVEIFLEMFDQTSMDQLISGILTQEIKTTEIYLSVLKKDVSFPNYPSAVKIDSPRVYYNLYMEYIKRYENHSDKFKNENISKYGPNINEGSYFNGNSAFSTNKSNFEQIKDSVFNSVLGPNVKLGNNSKVEDSILFGDVVVGDNCNVKGSVVMNNVFLLDNVSLETGSIVGADCTVKSGYQGKLKCASFETKFYDLTTNYTKEKNNNTNKDKKNKEDKEKENTKETKENENENENKTYVWDMDAFTSGMLEKIGDNFYDYLEFSLPESDSEFEGSVYSEEFEDDFEEEEETDVSEEFKMELSTMVLECLVDPKNLENKLLEIRSLRVAHNVGEEDMLKIVYSCGIKWVVEHNLEDELQEVIEESKFAKLMGSFSMNLTNLEFFEETLKVCKELGKNMLFFCLLCEALYHTDVLDFDGFQSWVSEKKFTEPRLISFAEWLESD